MSQLRIRNVSSSGSRSLDNHKEVKQELNNKLTMNGEIEEGVKIILSSPSSIASILTPITQLKVKPFILCFLSTVDTESQLFQGCISYIRKQVSPLIF